MYRQEFVGFRVHMAPRVAWVSQGQSGLAGLASVQRRRGEAEGWAVRLRIVPINEERSSCPTWLGGHKPLH